MCERVRMILLAGIAAALVAGCETTRRSTSNAGPGTSPAELARRSQILAEPRGDYYIGRRYHIDRTKFWGYLRRPGQQWWDSKLVMMNESRKRTPDRLPEYEYGGGRQHAYDHNYEYRITGRYSGKKVYDPNSNLFLPEFILTGYTLMSAEPGWLFRPNETDNDPSVLPFVPGR